MTHSMTLCFGLTLLVATTGPGAALAQDAPLEQDEMRPSQHPLRNRVLEEIRSDEVLHRERLATIHRLMQLAEEQGRPERLAALDKLEVKEDARYHRQFERRRMSLDDPSFRKAQLVLGKGRTRDSLAEALASRANRVVPEEKLRQRREAAGIAPDDPRIQTGAQGELNRAREAQGTKPATPEPKAERSAGSAPDGEPSPPKPKRKKKRAASGGAGADDRAPRSL
jgi:hypothetical protein